MSGNADGIFVGWKQLSARKRTISIWVWDELTGERVHVCVKPKDALDLAYRVVKRIWEKT